MTKEERKEYMKKYYQINGDKLKKQCEKYRQSHREERRKYYSKYYQINREKILRHYRQYYQTHREEIGKKQQKYHWMHKKENVERKKLWRKNNPKRERETTRKHNNKRERNLGFNPLNEWFEGSNAHHINFNDVIYIPEGLHRSIPHNVWTGKNMSQINCLAYQFLMGDYITYE